MIQIFKSKRVLLLLVGVLFHLLYLWSIFDIYFVSPLVHGMKLHLSTPNPPAKRLFLIVGDGQRADKTLAKIRHPVTETDEYLAPYLRSLIQSKGTYGISHTRMPTESRPGHVAMIAGFYEDVSAVTKGWKENPVDFDSVFNQSTHTYSFGSPDILPMFSTGASDSSKVDTWMYGHEFEDFSKSSIELDTFVFNHLNQLFENSTVDAALNDQIRQDGNVFFLHLLGTDTAGHGYRPYSSEYYDNIKNTDNELKKLIPKVNKFFGDEMTAFVFTADHGMSDFGSHGDGHPDNTRTPIVCWGAGCKTPVHIDPSENQYLLEESEEMETWDLNTIKRHDMKQADIASLMSYLVGLNYPANSVGELPMDFIDAPESDKINGLYQNSLSILEQYLVKLSEVSASQFQFKPYPEFETRSIDSYKFEIESLISLIEGGDESVEQQTIKLIEEFMSTTLNGLDYLQKYNWLLLRSIVTMGFIGWIVYSFVIFLQLFILPDTSKDTESSDDNKAQNKSFLNYLFFGSITSILTYVLFYQRSPMNYYMYLAFPIFFWNNILNMKTDLFNGLFEFFKGLHWITVLIILISIVGFFECITYGFTERNVFTFMSFGLGVYPILISRKISLLRFIPWFLACSAMSFFPSQNPVKTESIEMIIGGGALVIIISAISLQMLRSRIHIDSYTQSLIVAQIALVILSLYSTTKAVISLQLREGLPKDAQILGWLNLVVSLTVLPVLHHFKPNKNYKVRFLTIFLIFSPAFIILTISFETLFYVIYSSLILQWIEIESTISTGSTPSTTSAKNKKETIHGSNSNWLQLLRISIIGFFFLQIAFFGTGNIASISSFSLDSVYRLLPIFDPFPMGALLMLKLIIPYVILSIGLGLMNIKLHLKSFSISSLIISMSDLLSLNFFFLVKTNGSWLDIGLTISNYCLAILNSLFILILELLANFLLHSVDDSSKIKSQLDKLVVDNKEYKEILKVIKEEEKLGGSIALRVRQRTKKA